MEELDIDCEWDQFISTTEYETTASEEHVVASQLIDQECPKATDIYISTKTNISYLNTPIDLKNVFWNIPIIRYGDPVVGVVKKQMKFNSTLPEELVDIQTRLKNEVYVDEHVITNIDNPNGRIKFKDIRKVSIGISKKDVISYRSKKKSAFYNCFVMILRVKCEKIFKEFHVKVFNTGKLEIPGIQTDEMFCKIIDMVVHVLTPHSSTPIYHIPEKTQTVLINSNFNCGFYINREALFDILRSKYDIECIYDPCSYPGIQCKFYYNVDNKIQTGVKDTSENLIDVSFMIFRTGSILIVGKCCEDVLYSIYMFLKNILTAEFLNIGIQLIPSENIQKSKYKKVRKKVITIES
jgi:hypothetical protein